MHIAFRADASIQIGTGHVMRCLTLADALRERGARCTFICRPHGGHLLDVIAQRGHDAVALPLLGSTSGAFPADPAHAAWLGTDWLTDAQDTLLVLDAQPVTWLVVDHYALDSRWEQTLRRHCQNLMVIDDLADRPHECDVLLDQNLGRSAKDYSGLLNVKTATLIGPQYALLRPEFAQLREYSLKRRTNPQLKVLLITMGGVDQGNATGQVLVALKSCDLATDLRITVVMGRHAPWLTQVEAQAAEMPSPTQVLVDVNNMAQLMAESDLCIGASGSTSWERCCLGLPAIQLVLAANQKEINAALKLVGSVLTIHLEKLLVEIPNLISKTIFTDVLGTLSKSAAGVCDGLGVIKVVQLLVKETYEDYSALQ